MNRQIKFRAWNNEHKKMYKVATLFLDKQGNVTGVHVLFSGGIGAAVVTSPYVEAISVKVMQFTGLKDKNGKECYEGDIVTNGGIVAEVVYALGSTGFELRTKKGKFVGSPTSWENIEVVGNIYENPDLIK